MCLWCAYRLILRTINLAYVRLDDDDEARGGAVVEALRYKLGGHGFDSRW
jgi:hypothetical protein